MKKAKLKRCDTCLVWDQWGHGKYFGRMANFGWCSRLKKETFKTEVCLDWSEIVFDAKAK